VWSCDNEAYGVLGQNAAFPVTAASEAVAKGAREDLPCNEWLM